MIFPLFHAVCLLYRGGGGVMAIENPFCLSLEISLYKLDDEKAFRPYLTNYKLTNHEPL
jgi:hypothetical protein